MKDYELEFTDISIPIIEVDYKKKISSIIDITLFGYKKFDFGRELHENLLHIMENFALSEDSSNPGNPDLSQANYNLLSRDKPVTGQIWYNKTSTLPFLRFNNNWNSLEGFSQDVAANWGQIADGEQIPQPISVSGYVFPYSECSWIVSPFNQLDELEDMVCRTDNSANVTMKYLFKGDSTKTSGVANYMIVGLKDNNNSGTLQTPDELPSPTPTPTPSNSQGATPTPTPTPSNTQGATPTSTPTPTPTPSKSGATADPADLSLVMFDPYTGSCTDTDQNGTCQVNTSVSPNIDYSVSGGSGNYSYNWEYFFGTPFSFSSTTSSSIQLTRSSTAPSTRTGTGRLTVTDDDTGDSVSSTFKFNTTHNDVEVSPTPTPTPSPSMEESNTPTPTPSNTPVEPTPTPTPTPSNSITYDPLNVTALSFVNNDSERGCNGSSNIFYWNASTLNNAVTITGGSGNYNITGLPNGITKTVQCSLPNSSTLSTYILDAIAVEVEDNVTGETAGPFLIEIRALTYSVIPFTIG